MHINSAIQNHCNIQTHTLSINSVSRVFLNIPKRITQPDARPTLNECLMNAQMSVAFSLLTIIENQKAIESELIMV